MIETRSAESTFGKMKIGDYIAKISNFLSLWLDIKKLQHRRNLPAVDKLGQ